MTYISFCSLVRIDGDSFALGYKAWIFWVQLSCIMQSFMVITNYNIPFSFPWCLPLVGADIDRWISGGMTPLRTLISALIHLRWPPAPALRLCYEGVVIVPWRSTIRIRSWSMYVWPHHYVG
jgi:hypothetical protein